MDFSYFQNIMEPNDFARLAKLDKYDPCNLLKIVYKYPKTIDLMLEYFKANPKVINKYIGNCKSSLLMSATEHHINIIKNICELNVNVNRRDKHGWTALTYAAYNNNINAAKVLLEFDATTNIVTKWVQVFLDIFQKNIQKKLPQW